jgi:hypothetical protein
VGQLVEGHLGAGRVKHKPVGGSANGGSTHIHANDHVPKHKGKRRFSALALAKFLIRYTKIYNTVYIYVEGRGDIDRCHKREKVRKRIGGGGGGGLIVRNKNEKKIENRRKKKIKRFKCIHTGKGYEGKKGASGIKIPAF